MGARGLLAVAIGAHLTAPKPQSSHVPDKRRLGLYTVSVQTFMTRRYSLDLQSLAYRERSCRDSYLR